MTTEQVERAKDEALRFAERAERLLVRVGDEYDPKVVLPKLKEVGLVKRASLDLTAALADMRQCRGADNGE